MSTSIDPHATPDTRSLDALMRELEEQRSTQRAFVERAGKLHRLMSSLGGTPSRTEVAHLVANQDRELCGAAAFVLRRGDTKLTPYAEVPRSMPQPVAAVRTIRRRERCCVPVHLAHVRSGRARGPLRS